MQEFQAKQDAWEVPTWRDPTIMQLETILLSTQRSDLLHPHPAQWTPLPISKWPLVTMATGCPACLPTLRGVDLSLLFLACQLTHILLRMSYEKRNNATLNVTYLWWDALQFQKTTMWKKMSHRNQKLRNSFLCRSRCCAATGTRDHFL